MFEMVATCVRPSAEPRERKIARPKTSDVQGVQRPRPPRACREWEAKKNYRQSGGFLVRTIFFLDRVDISALPLCLFAF
jgi:hypothetical protein